LIKDFILEQRKYDYNRRQQQYDVQTVE